ncbi:RNA polymerase sigma factor, partial [Marinitenerispora sediminis]
MTAHRGSGRHRVDADVAYARLLRDGRGHAECYAVFAPGLYQYCWSLLGPRTGTADPAGEAVREALLAAGELIGRLGDHGDLRPWLFALARTACQRRGFARRTPYAELPAVESERPLLLTMPRLPPSYRELLELYLRHGLAPSQIAGILGLDAETAGELCRASVRRAIDELSATASAPGRPGATQWALVDVVALLEAVAPPGPPDRLRHDVLADWTAPECAAERRRLADLMRPLGVGGFPLHRSRSEAAAEASAPEPAAQGGGGPGEEEVVALPADRITTADTPAVDRTEPLAEISPEPDEPADDEAEKSRWTTPVVAGLATVAIALSLWGVGVLLAEGPSTTIAEVAPSTPAAPAPGSGIGEHGSPDQLTAPEPRSSATAHSAPPSTDPT